MKIINNRAVFSTGVTRYCGEGDFGLARDGNVSYGYAGIFFYPEEDSEIQHPTEQLTSTELTELADHMIEKWTKFKAQFNCPVVGVQPGFKPAAWPFD